MKGSELVSAKPLLSILTVFYESAPTLRKTFPSWAEALENSEGDIEILAIENSQCFDSQPLLVSLSKFADIKFLKEETNLGFAKSINNLASIASAEWLLILNPDVFLYPDTLGNITHSLREDPQAEAFSLSLRDLGGKETSGIGINKLGFFIDLPSDSRFALLGPTAAATLIRRDSFLNLGGYNPDLFMWLEDAEFALRLTRSGITTQTLDTYLEHVGGHSLSSQNTRRDKAFLMARNRLWILRSHFSAPYRLTMGTLVVAAMTANLFTRKLPRGLFFPYLRGMNEGLLGALPQSLTRI